MVTVITISLGDLSYLTGGFLGAKMLFATTKREDDFPIQDLLSALPTGIAARRAHRRLMLVTGATAYVSGATLLLSFLS